MKRVEDVASTDVVQVVIHGALFPALVDWLHGQDFRVVPLPGSIEEDEAGLSTFGVSLGEERARAAGIIR